MFATGTASAPTVYRTISMNEMGNVVIVVELVRFAIARLVMVHVRNAVRKKVHSETP
jgi:hypothetical protein